MTDETLTDTQMRQFLLGQLNDTDRRRVEEIFVCDADTRERILIAEEELIEDYLDGSLSSEETKRFRTHYLTSPQQHQKLKFARSLRQYVIDETTESRPVADETPSKLRSFWESLGFRSRIVAIPIVATLSAVVIAGSVWLIWLQRSNVGRDDWRIAMEKELEDLNTPEAIASAQSGPEIFSTAVSNITVRSISKALKVPPGTRIVELWLKPTTKDGYTSYQVELNKVGSHDKLVIRNLRLESASQGEAIRLRIPASLTHDDYHAVLFGVTAAGQIETLDDYTLQFEN